MRVGSAVGATQVEGLAPQGVGGGSRLAAGTTDRKLTEPMDHEIERLIDFKKAGLTDIAIRIYKDPEASIRLIGERVIPALQ